MYDTKERIRRVELRVRELQCKRKNKYIGGLSALCLLLTFSLIGTIKFMATCIPDNIQASSQGTYGAMLLYEDAGGYVLVAVVAFAAAVVITALCIRHRNKREKNVEGE